jgi:hypothetical protein
MHVRPSFFFLFNISRTNILRTVTDSGWIFAQHFCNRLGQAYLQLKNVLDETNPAHEEVLNDIKVRFREETFTRESIEQVIHAYPELVSGAVWVPCQFDLMDFLDADSAVVCQFCDGALPSD